MVAATAVAQSDRGNAGHYPVVLEAGGAVRPSQLPLPTYWSAPEPTDFWTITVAGVAATPDLFLTPHVTIGGCLRLATRDEAPGALLGTPESQLRTRDLGAVFRASGLCPQGQVFRLDSPWLIPASNAGPSPENNSEGMASATLLFAPFVRQREETGSIVVQLDGSWLLGRVVVRIKHPVEADAETPEPSPSPDITPGSALMLKPDDRAPSALQTAMR